MKLKSIRYYSPGSRTNTKRDPRITQRLAWRARVRRMFKQVLREQMQLRSVTPRLCSVQIIPAPQPHPEIHWLPENYFRAPMIPNRNYWDN